MGRTLQVPGEMASMRLLALFLLEGDLSSYRAVADALSTRDMRIDHTTIRLWDKQKNADGTPRAVYFDRHHSMGENWELGIAMEKQAARARRRAAERGDEPASGDRADLPQAASPTLADADVQGLSAPRRRNRARKIGPRLQRFLDGAPEPRAKRDPFAERTAWATPELRERVALILEASGSAGISTAQFLERLPEAFSEVDAEFVADIERVLVTWGVARRVDNRWHHSPPAPSL